MHIYVAYTHRYQIWGSSGERPACVYLDVDFTGQIGYRISGCKTLWSTHTEIVLGEHAWTCKCTNSIMNPRFLFPFNTGFGSYCNRFWIYR